MRIATFLAVLIVLAAPACDEADGVAVEYATARVMADCAPWDGPALTVVLTDSAAATTAVDSAHMRVSVWRGIAGLTGKRIDLVKEGAASRCSAAGDCTPAMSGWVRFDDVDTVHVTGRFVVAFADSTLRGSFDALWQKRTALCG
jgi:hypothetical protein